MSQQVYLKAAGLYTSPNQLDIPEGALSTASNIIIKRDNVIESRRGFKLYGTGASSIMKQLFTYKGRLLRHFGTTLQFDTLVLNNDGESIFNSFAGSYTEVEPGLRIKSIESNGNFYFTTNEGIKKISASNASQFSTTSGYITNAGGVKAINASAHIDFEQGNISGFLPGDSAVAYRIVWGRKDANNNLILGTPSERTVVYNPLMGFLIPDFDTVLGALDNITETTTTAFIGDGDYVSTLHLDASASPIDLQAQLISLAEKIDEDIYYAKAAPVTTEPLTITTLVISGGVATITFGVGNPTDYFEAGSQIFLANFASPSTSGNVNGAQTIVNVTATTITFNTDAVGTVAITGPETIVSNEYRYIVSHIAYNDAEFDLNTLQVDSPASNDQLKIMQAAIDQIITQLQAEPDDVISTANKTTYIDPLDITTSTNVILDINIPDGIDSNYFLQIYRSDIALATGTTVLSDLTPNDEMKLVYEAFPTSAELLAGEMTVLDIVVDDFRGANLYTNPSTGEGILQANDVPPIAHDINRFKNVIFYANTKTRHRTNLNLLGVQNFKAGGVTSVSAGNPAVITTDEDHELASGQIVYINGTGIPAIDGLYWPVTVLTDTTFSIPVSGAPGSSTGYWTNSFIAIVDENGSREYKFIKEVAEERTFTAGTKAATNEGTLGDNYFTIYSGKNETSYYVWFNKGTGVDPAITGSKGIEVDISSVAIVTASDVAARTRAVLQTYTTDFTTTGATTSIIVTNNKQGIATDSTTVNLGAGWSVTTGIQGRGENAALNEVGLSTSVSPAIAVDETARSLQNVVNSNSAESVYIYYLSGLADVPGKMLFEGRSLSSPMFSIIANNFDTGDSFDPAITPSPNLTITNTAANPTVVTATAHGLVSGDNVVIAFSNSTPSIDGVQLVTFLSANTFSVPVNVTIAGTTGVIINESQAISSENEEKANRIYFSKFQQPEAVPIVNYFDVGSEEKAIVRILPLRDSLFVFKEDGVFRISGEAAPFNLALFDSSCVLQAPDSLSITNNTIYGWTDQGINTITESGVDPQAISRPIDQDMLILASSNYANFKTVTWGVGYDSDNSYTVYTNKETDDTVATIGYRYGTLTGTWTTIDKTNTCGLINSVDDKMYMGAGDVTFMEQERKSFTRIDYADRELTSSLTANNFFESGARMKIPSVAGIEVGDVLYQEQRVTVYNYNTLLAKLDLDPGIALIPITSISTGVSPLITLQNFAFAPADVNTGTDTITIPLHGFVDGQKVRFVSSGTLPAPLIANTDYWIINSALNTFQLTTIRNGTVINLTTTGTGTHTCFRYHNLVIGDSVTLSNTNSDPIIDGTYIVESIPTGYSYTITTTNPVTTAGTSGGSRFDYSETLEMAGGDDIRLKLIALANKLDTDSGTQFANYFDRIDSKTGLIVLNSAANPTVITIKNTNFAPADVIPGTDTINIVGHGFTAGQEVTFTSSGTLPGGIVAGVTYFIVFVDANNFQLSLSPYLFPIVDITSIGTGTHNIKLSHELANDRLITITGTNSVPVIDGVRLVDVVTANTFSVPVSVTISGSAGSYSTNTASYLDLVASYNEIINRLNIDPGPVFNSYSELTGTVPIESLITSVNTFTNEITLAPAINFLVGPLTIFKAIETNYTYCPQTMGDPLNWKHLTYFTMMFENKAFTNATISFASDLLPEFIPTVFNGDGNGIFGHIVNFGNNFFGGGSHGAPFRTSYPRQVMRCRYVLINWRHRIARERFSIFGCTIDGNTGISSRAYRG